MTEFPSMPTAACATSTAANLSCCERRSGRVGGEVQRGSSMTIPGAAEVNQGDEGCGGVKAEAAVADQADAAVEAFEAAVGQSEADRGEDAGAVAADRARELDER